MAYKQFRIEVGNRIKEMRLAQGLTQEDMDSGKNAVSWRTIQNIENSEHDIKLETLHRVAKRLGVAVKDLVDV